MPRYKELSLVRRSTTLPAPIVVLFPHANLLGYEAAAAEKVHIAGRDFARQPGLRHKNVEIAYAGIVAEGYAAVEYVEIPEARIAAQTAAERYDIAAPHTRRLAVEEHNVGCNQVGEIYIGVVDFSTRSLSIRGVPMAIATESGAGKALRSAIPPSTGP